MLLILLNVNIYACSVTINASFFFVKKVNEARFSENHQVFEVKGKIVFQKNAFDIQAVEMVAVNNPYLVKYIKLKSELKSKNHWPS